MTQLPTHLVAPARAEAHATGVPFGVIADRLIAEQRQREQLDDVRGHAATNTKRHPEPVSGARKPHMQVYGPRDAAIMRKLETAACAAYLLSGDPRDLKDIIVKSPEWYRHGHWAWHSPHLALMRLPKNVARILRDHLGDIFCTYSRGVTALVYLISKIAQRTKRSGVQVLAGCSLGLLAACIPSYVRGHRTLSASALKQRRHGGAPGVPGTEGPKGGLAGDCRRHDCGYVEAIRQMGLGYAWQPPAGAVPKWQTGPRGYACLQILFPDTVWGADAQPA